MISLSNRVRSARLESVDLLGSRLRLKVSLMDPPRPLISRHEGADGPAGSPIAERDQFADVSNAVRG